MSKRSKKGKMKPDAECGFVYSTNPNFALAGLADLLGTSEDDNSNILEVHLEKKHRGGKTALIIKGFTGSNDELNDLAKKLKSNMGVGGSAKDGEIIIQGNKRDKVMELLEQWGYKTKRVGA